MTSITAVDPKLVEIEEIINSCLFDVESTDKVFLHLHLSQLSETPSLEEAV